MSTAMLWRNSRGRPINAPTAFIHLRRRQHAELILCSTKTGPHQNTAMLLSNQTAMTGEERQKIGAWIAAR